MNSTAKRTLVKSAPELWELADDREQMQSWLGEVSGRHTEALEVVEREPEQRLAWRDGDVSIALELAEDSFGTTVRISTSHDREAPGEPEATLERLLDELGSPERRPFTRD